MTRTNTGHARALPNRRTSGRVRRRTCLCLSLLLAAALAGCSQASGDPGTASPSAAPAASSTASAAATPSPTPSAAYKPASAQGPAENVPLPVMPEEAKVQSKEGLEAFARYWYELVNYGYESGDVSPVQSLSDPTCLACQNYYEVVTGSYADSGWITAGEIQVKEAATEYVLTSEGRFQVLVVIQQDDMEFHSPQGYVGVDDGDESPVVQLFEATYADQRWRLEFIDTMKTPSS